MHISKLYIDLLSKNHPRISKYKIRILWCWKLISGTPLLVSLHIELSKIITATAVRIFLGFHICFQNFTTLKLNTLCNYWISHCKSLFRIFQSSTNKYSTNSYLVFDLQHVFRNFHPQFMQWLLIRSFSKIFVGTLMSIMNVDNEYKLIV